MNLAMVCNIVSFLALLNEEPSGGGSLDFSGLISALTGSVAASDILTYLGVIVAGVMTIALAWIFGRKAIRAFISAVRSGNVKV